MQTIDEMKGLSSKGKALIKGLHLERLVTEDYLKQLYEKHKEFFDDPNTHLLPAIEASLIGKEVLTDLGELPQDAKDALEKCYKPTISPRANAIGVSQGIFVYVWHQLDELGYLKKKEATNA